MVRRVSSALAAPLRLFGGGLQGLLLLLGQCLDLRQLICQGGLLVLGFFSGFGRVLYRLALTLEFALVDGLRERAPADRPSGRQIFL